jgi:hypothetical protein
MAETGKRYELHELSQRLPKHTPEEKTQMKRNMVLRCVQGLPPLEEPILLIDGKIGDGRHRYEYWLELAEEGACDGYFAKHEPPVVEAVAEGQDGGATVLLRLHSRNLCHRNLPADQRAAHLLSDIESNAELKAVVEKIEADNRERMKAGIPLDTKSQGSSTNEQLAAMANVSPSTIKAVKQAFKEAPDQASEIVQGNKSAKEVLREAKSHSSPEPIKSKPKSNSKKDQPPANPKKSKMNISISVSSRVEFVEKLLVKKGIERNFLAPEDDTTTLEFDGTGKQQADVLEAIAAMLKAKGPMTAGITLDK